MPASLAEGMLRTLSAHSGDDFERGRVGHQNGQAPVGAEPLPSLHSTTLVVSAAGGGQCAYTLRAVLYLDLVFRFGVIQIHVLIHVFRSRVNTREYVFTNWDRDRHPPRGTPVTAGGEHRRAQRCSPGGGRGRKCRRLAPRHVRRPRSRATPSPLRPWRSREAARAPAGVHIGGALAERAKHLPPHAGELLRKAEEDGACSGVRDVRMID